MPESRVASVRFEGNIGWIETDNPSVNATEVALSDFVADLPCYTFRPLDAAKQRKVT